MKRHKSVVKTGLHEITLKEYKHVVANYDILPGQKLCRRCLLKLFPEHEEVDPEEEHQNLKDLSLESATEIVNQSLLLLDCSPLKTAKNDRTIVSGKRKINNANKMFSKAVAVALEEPEFEEQQSECMACVRLVEL